VFGLLYAQAEDDFNRVETNYFDALGRAAEWEGEGAIYRDLRMRLINNPDSLKALYSRSPRWLQSVMNAYADGLNYYLYKHPEVKPKVIANFEPWMPLAFSDGSIGPDIESVNLTQLAAFYGGRPPNVSSALQLDRDADRGLQWSRQSHPQHALASRTPPHQSAHVVFLPRRSAGGESGGIERVWRGDVGDQFFVYQGFNARAGWMHSSPGPTTSTNISRP